MTADFDAQKEIGMTQISGRFVVDGKPELPNYARFIFQADPCPGGHLYELAIPLGAIDPEVLDHAKFDSRSAPDEGAARHWFFWLGHIVSRLWEPEDPQRNGPFILNNISELRLNGGMLIVTGECSEFVSNC
ncbi:MAG TPA: hypothetical protein VG826_11745 [Pirellulales bacterium]|nr:hypothetical protein [Pirellulales bacterium]